MEPPGLGDPHQLALKAYEALWLPCIERAKREGKTLVDITLGDAGDLKVRNLFTGGERLLRDQGFRVESTQLYPRGPGNGSELKFSIRF